MKRATALVTILVIVSGSAIAHEGAMGIVKERMDGMKAMQDSMALIGRMVKGESEYDPDVARRAAREIARHGMEMRDLYPDTPESRQPVSEATELVWTDRERFDRLADDLVELANLLAEVSDEGDASVIASDFRSLGKACSACHEDFHKKKN